MKPLAQLLTVVLLGSLPGQANLSRLVLTKETLKPSLAKRMASALISGSVNWKYSFLPFGSFFGGFRISTFCNPYW